MDEIRRGDVVTLRSGGPRMTVEAVQKLFGQPGLSAHCSWFDAQGVRHQGWFAVEALQKGASTES